MYQPMPSIDEMTEIPQHNLEKQVKQSIEVDKEQFVEQLIQLNNI